MGPDWDFTFDEFYNGNWKGCAKCLYTSMAQEMKTKEDWRFPVIEIIFFKRWWDEQKDQTVKDTFKELVNTGKVEFLNGGWVMNDNACANYDHILDQFALGHRFIAKEFNKYPEVAWQIDPFGNSATQAYLLSKMGYHALYMDRIHYGDFKHRIDKGEMQFMWNPFGKGEGLIGHVDYKNYWVSPEVNSRSLSCPYIVCYQNHLSDVVLFVNWVWTESTAYPINKLMHPIGGDFDYNWGLAQKMSHLEDLRNAINNDPNYGIQAKISSVSEYFDEILEDADLQQKLLANPKTDDFFTYVDSGKGAWSGYFSSRPTLKAVVTMTL